ncbi:hypothetical protein EVAR_47075_1 [Eumeta japonica]|uniref:Uncharacterized protein n=1 Tax=Eumeta variegata TaxID=151549 RepID=A0A4C1WKD6_EUMVA|nr:hypothetical protein EVAR_47075_1 [Eumeta japonica]
MVESNWGSGVKNISLDPDGTTFNFDHGRIDRWLISLSQIEALAPCLLQYIKPSVPGIEIEIMMITVSNLKLDPGQRRKVIVAEGISWRLALHGNSRDTEAGVLGQRVTEQLRRDS